MRSYLLLPVQDSSGVPRVFGRQTETYVHGLLSLPKHSMDPFQPPQCRQLIVKLLGVCVFKCNKCFRHGLLSLDSMKCSWNLAGKFKTLLVKLYSFS